MRHPIVTCTAAAIVSLTWTLTSCGDSPVGPETEPAESDTALKRVIGGYYVFLVNERAVPWVTETVGRRQTLSSGGWLALSLDSTWSMAIDRLDRSCDGAFAGAIERVERGSFIPRGDSIHFTPPDTLNQPFSAGESRPGYSGIC